MLFFRQRPSEDGYCGIIDMADMIFLDNRMLWQGFIVPLSKVSTYDVSVPYMKLNPRSVLESHDTFLESLDAHKPHHVSPNSQGVSRVFSMLFLPGSFGDEARYLTELGHFIKSCKQRKKAANPASTVV